MNSNSTTLNNSQALIQVKELTLQLGQQLILQNLSLDIFQHEVLALIGPNGAGKSSLLQVLSGFVKASSGQVIYQTKNRLGIKPHQMKHLAWARGFQTSSLFANLTVKEHLIAGSVALSRHPYSFFRHSLLDPISSEKIRQLLQDFDLLKYQDAYPHELSYAHQRGLDLALLCIGQAKVLLLDEPTAGLSQSETTTWVQKFKYLRQNKTVLLVEHDMDLVFAIADRIAVLDQGQIIAIGSASEIQVHPKVQQAYLGQLLQPSGST